MKTAFTTLACPDWELDEVVRAASDNGYDAVDFRGLHGTMGVYILSEFSDEADETRGRLAEAGLAVSCFSSSARMCNPDRQTHAKSLSEVREYTRLCRRFDAQMIRVFGGTLHEATRSEAVSRSVSVLEEMARMAAPVVIAVETHDDWVESARLAEVMQAVAADNVGVLWDLHHPYRLAGERPEQTYETLRPWIVNTHVKDSRPTGAEPDAYEYVLPGEGDVPLEEMISLLAGGGYDGYLTLEWEKAWHPQLAAPEVAIPAYAKFLQRFT